DENVGGSNLVPAAGQDVAYLPRISRCRGIERDLTPFGNEEDILMGNAARITVERIQGVKELLQRARKRAALEEEAGEGIVEPLQLAGRYVSAGIRVNTKNPRLETWHIRRFDAFAKGDIQIARRIRPSSIQSSAIGIRTSRILQVLTHKPYACLNPRRFYRRWFRPVNKPDAFARRCPKTTSAMTVSSGTHLA